MSVDFMQAAVEAKLYKMLQADIAIDDIVCIVPVPELEGPLSTGFGVIEAKFSKSLPSKWEFYLIRRNHLRI